MLGRGGISPLDGLFCRSDLRFSADGRQIRLCRALKVTNECRKYEGILLIFACYDAILVEPYMNIKLSVTVS